MIKPKTYITFDIAISPLSKLGTLILKQPISQSTKEKTMGKLEGVPWDILETGYMH